MRITQAYVSKSIMDFPFHQTYALDDYNADLTPSVFFGMYRFEDWQLYYNHGAEALCFWTGQDALSCEKWIYGDLNFTAHPKVKERLNSFGVKCELVQPAAFLNTVNPQQLGPKIYAYCPRSAEDYHGKKVLDELRLMGYEILIGDGSIPQNLWKHSCKGFYDDIFVGLCLSSFAGGGGSIIEMGLRGIPVITNVFNLPNCIGWSDAQGIAREIELLKSQIGSIQNRVAEQVWHSLDHEHKWLEI